MEFRFRISISNSIQLKFISINERHKIEYTVSYRSWTAVGSRWLVVIIIHLKEVMLWEVLLIVEVKFVRIQAKHSHHAVFLGPL